MSVRSVLSAYHAAGQTRDVDPIRALVISPVLGYRVMFDATLHVGQRHRRRASINPAFIQSIVGVLQPA